MISSLLTLLLKNNETRNRPNNYHFDSALCAVKYESVVSWEFSQMCVCVGGGGGAGAGI